MDLMDLFPVGEWSKQKNKVGYDRHCHCKEGEEEHATQLSGKDKLQAVNMCASKTTGSFQSVGSRFLN